MADDDVDAPGPFPKEGLLAKRWDSKVFVRERMRAEHKLLIWPSKAMVGAASIPSLCLNRFIIAEVLLEWCPFCHEPKAPPIDWIRREAGVAKPT